MWFEVWYNEKKEHWEIFKVTEHGACYMMYKTYKTETAVKNWERKQGRRVIWH